jgi:hypothetical protein
VKSSEQEEEPKKNREGIGLGLFFKSFEEGSNQVSFGGQNQSRQIIPLYESPEYHQNRIIKKQ